jgi:hypothetical protein
MQSFNYPGQYTKSPHVSSWSFFYYDKVFSISLLLPYIVKKREISSSLITKMTRITRKLIKTTYKTFKQSPKLFKRFSSYSIDVPIVKNRPKSGKNPGY